MDARNDSARLFVRSAAVMLAFLVVSLSLVMLPASASADTGLEVLQVGWDGAVVPNSWSPVRVRVTGGPSDVTGRVEVVLKVKFQPGPAQTTVEHPVGAYGQELTLPAGVSKELTIWVPPDGNPSAVGDVRLIAGDQLMAEERVEFRSSAQPYWPLIGVLAESPSVARTLGSIELSTQGLPIPLSVARLSAADIPPVADRLRALSGIVVQGNAASTFTAEQREAVRAWISAGGHLVLLGGPDAARAASVVPTGTLPVTFQNVQAQADLAAIGEWAGVRQEKVGPGPISSFEVRGGSVLAGTQENPLAWRVGIGKGTVTVLAADPSLEPLSGWPGTPLVVKKALEPAIPNASENEKLLYMRMAESDTVMQLQDAANSLPTGAYPDWRQVALLLGGFAILVGPVLHILLRRLDRRGWVWLGVPAAAILLSGALYYAGVGRDGRDVLLHVVSHVRLDPAGGRAQQLLFAGFFAPTHEALVVTLPGDAPVRVGSGYGGYGGYYGPGGATPGSSEPPYRVTTGRDTRVQFTSGQWGMRYVNLNRDLGQSAGGITAQLSIEEGLIKGTVRNETPYRLEDAAVVVAQSVAKLGSLAPGQTAQVVLDPGSATAGMDLYGGGYSLQMLLFGEPVDGSTAAGPMYGYPSSRSVAVAVPQPAMPAAPVGAPPVVPMTPTPATPPGQGPSPTAETPRPEPSPGSSTAPGEKPAYTPTPTATQEANPTPTPASSGKPAQPPVSAASYPVPPMMGPPMMIPNDPDIQRKVRLLNPIVNVPRWGPGQISMPLTFFAYTSDLVGDELPSASGHPSYYLSLLQQPLSLHLPAGPFTMPAGLIPGEVVSQTAMGMGGGSNGSFSWLEVSGGDVVYEFRPPLPSRAQPEALVITTQQFGSSFAMGPGGKGYPAPSSGMPEAAATGLFSIYNWEMASWDSLPGGAERTRISPAAPYIGPEGKVRLQVTAPVDQTVRFIQPDLAVEGRVDE